MGISPIEKKQIIYCICGYKNSGKTTLIVKLIPKLTERGYRVAVIKHDGHDFESDVPGTDSWKHQKAGAYGTAVFSKNRMMLTKECGSVDETILAQCFPEADIILVEGLKDSKYPKYRCDYPHRMPIDVDKLADRIEALWKGEQMGTIRAICISEKKGTQKYEIPETTVIEDFGLENDAHAGKWHRQVSMLPLESIEEFRAKGANLPYGAFGENLVISGFDLKSFPIGTKFRCGDVVLELTQIGKECHHGCQIRRQMGDCIMPREGVFCRVLKGGRIKTGDAIFLVSEEIE